MQFVWLVLAFLSGALPWSVWIGKLALGMNIRQVGDGNPGATNVWKAGGARWGILTLLADFAKGLLPVAIANFVFGWSGWWLTAVTITPVLGHAFSPFLHFQGGKALAVTFGVWTGLTLYVAPLILGLAFVVWLFLFKKDSWAVIGGSLTQLAVFLLLDVDWVWLAAWVGITAVLIWKQKRRTEPIVDHKVARERTLQAYKVSKK